MSFKAQIKEIVPVLEKAGLTCKVASRGLGALTISLNNVDLFGLYPTRDGKSMLIGGENGFEGSEKFGYSFTNKLAKLDYSDSSSFLEGFTKLVPALVKQCNASLTEYMKYEYNELFGDQRVIIFDYTYKGRPCVVFATRPKKGYIVDAQIIFKGGATTTAQLVIEQKLVGSIYDDNASAIELGYTVMGLIKK